MTARTNVGRTFASCTYSESEYPLRSAASCSSRCAIVGLFNLTAWLVEDEIKPLLGVHNAFGEMAQTPVARECECDLRDALHVRCAVSGLDGNARPPEQNVLKAIKLNAVAGEITTET